MPDVFERTQEDAYRSKRTLDALIAVWEHATVEQMLHDVNLAIQYVMFRLHQEQQQTGTMIGKLTRQLHEQELDLVPDCICRNHVCGHRASQHTGKDSECTVPGCRCGPGGWT